MRFKLTLMKPSYWVMCSVLWASNVEAQTPSQYRSLDGTNNNLYAPNWGAAGIPLYRELPAEYGASDTKNAMGGANRPSPRLISNILSDEPQDIQNERNLSGLTYIWGQFLDHDITLSPTAEVESVPITIPAGDKYFTKSIPFTRSAVHPGTGVTNTREQTNLQTAWIDGSHIYGWNYQVASWLRTYKQGKLKVSAGNQLPYNTTTGEYDAPIDFTAPKMDDDKNRTKKTFVAGDPRAAEHPGLTSLHTLFVREHNRICDRLVGLGWTNDEEIYQKARKEIGALMQVITYTQWLSALGVQLNPYSGYKSNVRPDISNVFSTAAYRWHTMVENDIIFRDNDCRGIGPVELPLKDVFFNIDIIRKYGTGMILKGLSVHQQYETDLKVNNGLRNFLFGAGSGLDLVSINIQRGRDHGLPNYNRVRQFYTGTPANTFADITGEAVVSAKMQSLFGNVNNIDLWVGLYAEPRLPGKSVGKTVDAILRVQLEKLRDGDYYFYMNDPDLIYERARIAATTLGDIIARNTSANNFQPNVFIRKVCNAADGGDLARHNCTDNPNFDGWTLLGNDGVNFYYKWNSTANTSYNEAKLLVERLGGTLPQIRNATQNAFLVNRLGGASTWLDMTRVNGIWKYSDGTNVTYTNWNAGEPNNAGGVELNAEILPTGKWNDISSNTLRAVIAVVPLIDVTPPTFTFCPRDFSVPVGILTHCRPVSWRLPEATDNCSSVTITQTEGPGRGACLAPKLFNAPYPVSYVVRDAKGNSSVCRFNINVYKSLSLFLDTKESIAIGAVAEPNKVFIEWVNNTGTKNDYFELEKLNTATGNFEKLQTINNNAVDNNLAYYTTYDNEPTEGDNTYRVKVVFKDGGSKISEAKTVVYKGVSDLAIFPNPVSDVLSIDLKNYKNQPVDVYLYNSLGQQKAVQNIDKVDNTVFEMNVSNLEVGNYMLRVKSHGKRDIVKSVIIAR